MELLKNTSPTPPMYRFANLGHHKKFILIPCPRNFKESLTMWCCGTEAKLPPAVPALHVSSSCCLSSPAPCYWAEKQQRTAQCLDLAFHVEETWKKLLAPPSWLWPGPTATNVAIWGVSLPMQALSYSLTCLSNKQTKKHTLKMCYSVIFQ